MISLLILLVLLLPASLAATTYKITKIADTTGQIADTQGGISSFPVGLSLPVINDTGDVVLRAVSCMG
jgi:hypothetical protein